MKELISVEQAIARIVEHRPDPAMETVALANALGRTLATDISARVTLPPRNASAMDGYAVRLADVVHAGSKLRLIGEAPAGSPFGGAINAGEAVRIFTGSAIPDGADHVVIQENVTRADEWLSTTTSEPKSKHIRRAGIDFRLGDHLLQAGRVLGPSEIAVAAAADHGYLPVHKRLRVAILANGDELRSPGSDPGLGDVVSSNSSGLAALVRSWGGEALDLGIAPDHLERIQALIRSAPDADVIVPVGGASVGDHDHMVGAFEALGLANVFRKVAVKPGKPTWFGLLDDQRVLGLPGNPASAMVCAHLFLKPLLVARTGLNLVDARMSHDLDANGPRETFLRSVCDIKDGVGRAVRVLPNQDSSLITPFLEANCLLRRASGAAAVGAGDRVVILPL